MATIKNEFLGYINDKFGSHIRIGNSQSLFSLQDDKVRIYIRYSKVHSKGSKCFYGLRNSDLRELEGHLSFICLLWDNQEKPLILPFSDFEDVFQCVTPADDGQYKCQLYLRDYGTEFYVAKAGRFGVDGYFGWDELSRQLEAVGTEHEINFSHSQIQTLLGAIGYVKHYDIWIPTNDRQGLDWSLTDHFNMCTSLSKQLSDIEHYLKEIDVIWIEKGSNRLKALYEVEHSTPIYSGLLRLNDIHLSSSIPAERFAIVANEKRRSFFSQQVNRPTFLRSGIAELCTFFNYTNVYQWYQRILDIP